MIKSKTFKGTLLGSFILVLIFPIAVSAYSSSYSFNIAHAVYGTTDYNLENKSTSTTAMGQTYFASGNVNPAKSAFSVTLDGSWLTGYSTGTIKANGSNYTKDFGTVKKGVYNINVFKSTAGPYGEYIDGSGTIDQ